MQTHTCAIHTSSPRFYDVIDNNEIPGALTIGGKARNLACLTKAGIPVPRWIVLSVHCYDEFIVEYEEVIQALLAKIESISRSQLKQISFEIYDCIMNIDFPRALWEEIFDLMRQAFVNPGEKHFAVRSSATDEDSIEFSFAGQLDSFLFQRYDESLFDAIKQCFASAFSERALSYRLANNISLENIKPAVIIQEMIFGDVSGVVFTTHPLTHNPDHAFVNATYGIGEGIVSGELNSDSWVVDESNVIISEKLDLKEHMIVFNNETGRGTKKIAVPVNKQTTPSLTKQDVQNLVAMSRKIEREIFSGMSMDIEWCIFENNLYILQARPITQLAHIDKTLERTIFDNSNVIESYSGVTSPLTFSYISHSFNETYKQFLRKIGFSNARLKSMAPYFRNMLGYINGRVYYNLLNWYRIFQVCPGSQVKNFETMIGVKETVAHDEGTETLWQRFNNKLHKLKIATILFLNLLFIRQVTNKFIRRFYKSNEKYLNEKFEVYSNKELVELYNNINNTSIEEWYRSLMNVYGAMDSFGKMKRMLEKSAIKDAATLQNDLLVAEGDIESTKPTQRIIEITNWIRESHEFSVLFSEKSEKELIEEILHSETLKYNELRAMLNDYIAVHGFRSMNELKLEELTIREDPTFLFMMIKNYLKKDPVNLGTMQGKDRSIRKKAEKHLFSGIGFIRKIQLRRILSRVRYHIKKREECRYIRAKHFGVIRGIVIAIGKNFKNDGILEKHEDIFYLTINEICELVEGRSANMQFLDTLIMLRKQDFADNLKKTSPERLYFYGDLHKNDYIEIFSESEVLHNSNDDSLTLFTGTPCGPGIVEGPAKVVLSSDEAILNGEILVTKRTDPGWIPLFPSISGLLIERGSVLSHSAVVAREMGIPTIVGLRGITNNIVTNEFIRVNGSLGVVEKIFPKDGESAS